MSKTASILDQLERIEKRLERLEKTLDQIPVPYIPPIDRDFYKRRRKCGACGMQLDTVMGYRCPRPDCPTGLGPTIWHAGGRDE